MFKCQKLNFFAGASVQGKIGRRIASSCLVVQGAMLAVAFAPSLNRLGATGAGDVSMKPYFPRPHRRSRLLKNLRCTMQLATCFSPLTKGFYISYWVRKSNLGLAVH